MTEKRERPDSVSPAAWAKWNGRAAPARAAGADRIRKSASEPAAGKCPASSSPAAWAVKTGRVAEGGPTHAMLKQLEGRGQGAFAAQFAEAVAVGAKLGAPLSAAVAAPSGSSRAARTVPAGSSTVDPIYARNPLVDEARRTRSQASLQAASDAPTLFHSGDLPPFTASGIDPDNLLRVPWQARHAIASAATTAQAFELLERYADDPVAAAFEQGGSLANADYQKRVNEWAVSKMTDAELYDATFGSGQ
jgi:hypothetical protein